MMEQDLLLAVSVSVITLCTRSTLKKSNDLHFLQKKALLND